MVFEPSGFATDWAGSSMTVLEIPEAYQQTVGAMNLRMRQTGSRPAGDPERAARIIVRVAGLKNPPSHLLLGVAAFEMSQRNSSARLREARAWERVSRSADFGEPFPVELPADTSPP